MKKLTKPTKLIKPGRTNDLMNKLVLSGKRPCNGHKDECKASQK